MITFWCVAAVLAASPSVSSTTPSLSLQVALVKLAHGTAVQRRQALGELPHLMSAADALPYVTHALKDPVSHNRLIAIDLLGSMQLVGLPPLIRHLSLSLPLAEYRKTLSVIGTQKEIHTAPALGSALRHTAVPARVDAIVHLTRLRDAAALPYFQQGLKDDAPKVRSLSAVGLGLLGEPVCLTLLLGHGADPHAVVRRNILRMLERFQHPAIILPLIQALNDPERANREEAFRIIKRLPAREEVRGALTRALESPQDGLPLRAAIALGELERPLSDALAVVIQSLTHADARVRLVAAETLGQWLDPLSIPALRTACRDAHPEVRRTARTALEMMGEMELETFTPVPWQ